MRPQLIPLLLVLAVGLGPVPALGEPTLAEVRVSPTFVTWQPLEHGSSFVLTIVAPDGRAIRHELIGGEESFFEVFDAAGQVLADGTYRWEMRRDAGQSRQRPVGELSGSDLESRGGSLESGVVTVLDGAFVQPGGVETAETVAGRAQSSEAPDGAALTRDQLILDDLIVDGSACIGLDCVNGESFGSDVARLKEVRVRLHLQDTSASPGFPANDWRLTANDTTSGGDNYLAIDDATAGTSPFRVQAGAPDHSLYVSSLGRIGLGTSTPTRSVHAISGDTPALRLQQDGSGGFGSQSWDVAGNETNFFIGDPGSSTLPFRLFPGAPTSSLVIGDTGFIGLSQVSPTANLHVNDASAAAAARTVMKISNNGGVRVELEDRSSGANQRWFVRNQAARFQIVDEVTADGDEMALDADGNLTILGTLTAGGGSTFPDYVFDDDYELLELAELETFIDREGHLPGIPSAAEVEARGGHDMTELQLRLLEKVEELTLYTLAQQRAIRELERRNGELETRLLEVDGGR